MKTKKEKEKTYLKKQHPHMFTDPHSRKEHHE